MRPFLITLILALPALAADPAKEPQPAGAAPNAGPELTADVVQHSGLAPAEAVKAATLPEGFAMSMFAAEPDIINPISFCIDDRGRLWVAEGLTYPIRAKDGEGRDRIVVFEDTTGDGVPDRRTVFMEGLNLVSGIEIGFGGLWVGAAPNLMFIPIADGDAPKPAGEAKILLDGWGFQDTHETLNTFRWGPDGWLYGCHGVFTNSNVGKPGAADDGRKKINGGFWRIHPVKHAFEIFGEGTSNPWGIDFDENGTLFAEACVIPHLFHIVPGGRFQRQAGQHFNPNTYDDIKTIADHRHYLGDNPHRGNGRSDAAGGGHAHAGLCIPQGDYFGEWENLLLMGNIHGARVNADIAAPAGSGFVGRHHGDFLNFNDAASQVVDIRQGPNGAIYMIDWHDLNQCHRPQREAHDYKTGRIYRITPPKPPGAHAGDLAKKSGAELLDLALSADAWLRGHALRLLQERKPDAAGLEKIVFGSDAAKALRALWARHAAGATSEEGLAAVMLSPHPHVRAWAIRFAAEDGSAGEATRAEFARLAKDDPSPVVRLALASAAQRLPVDERLPILAPLTAHAGDAQDHNLPLMLWYALEPVVGAKPAEAAALLGTVKIPVLQEYIARRMATTAGR